MNTENISVDEVTKIIHKDRNFVINAIQNRTFPGSITVSEGGRRNVHIPRKAFEDYMTKFHSSPSDELISALIEAYTKEKATRCNG